MMDMEMNAGLGDDDGSESSQSSSERSSASSTFCTLEKDYARIIQEMKTNEALAPYEAEYSKLFELLYNAHITEKQLTQECTELKEKMVDSTRTIQELRGVLGDCTEESENLKKDLENARKLADAAHTREQNAQEIIENLRLNVTKLHEEIEEKNRQLPTESNTASKQKEHFLREREKLQGEMETLKQRLQNMSLYTEELEKKVSASDDKMGEMQEALDLQLNEVSKQRRAKEKAETDVQLLQEELDAKTKGLEAANNAIVAAETNIANLERTLKEHKVNVEKMQKEINKLMVKRMHLQTDYDNANAQMEMYEKDIEEKEKELKILRLNISSMKKEASKCQFEKDTTEKKLHKLETENSKLEQELQQSLINVKNIECDSLALRKQEHQKQQQFDVLLREKNTLARSKETLKDQIKTLNHGLAVSDHGRKKIEHELELAMASSNETRKQLEESAKERDKHKLEAQELAQQVEEYINEAKLKQVEIFDYKKQLAEAVTRYRQQQNLFEAVRAERNSCTKSFLKAQEEIQELKDKFKTVSHQVEQLKEDIATKDANLVKEHFLLGRVEEEKEGLKVEVESCRKEISDLRREIEEMKKEEKALRQSIRQADRAIGKHKRDIDNAMNERDILGTQLVRRNDELSLQRNRIKVLNSTLQQGETQYNQRLEDIRLLKLEVKKLRSEKILLAKNIENISDLRQEVFHLNRDLANERLKVVALENEVQTPLNIHRWRKLEGTDPDKYDLLKKVHLLQKRVIRMSAEMIDKEKSVKDAEKLYMNLREVLSKQPGPEVTVSLNETQKALRERGNKMKGLVAVVNMYEAQVLEYKHELERVNNEMCQLKKKYYALKRKLDKSKESMSKSLSEPILPEISSQQKKFCGGGFNMATPAPRNCFTIAPASR